MDSYSTMEEGEPRLKYSIVVPFYNEEMIVQRLYERIVRVMRHVGQPYEMIFVNDGSRDGTPKVLERIALADERVVFVDLRRNFGQTTALQAGFDQSRGEVIIAMDGDLQHDPYEIPLFIKKIDEGYDIASGWRVRRGDNFMMRRFPSMVANWLLAKVSGVRPARLRHHLQGLPPRGARGRPPLRRHAPLRAGRLRPPGREDHRGAHQERPPQGRQEQLRHRPDVPRGAWTSSPCGSSAST